MKKPTGDAECPPEVSRAHEIDRKIQSKVACRDLEDGEIIDFEDSNGPGIADDEMSDSYDPLRTITRLAKLPTASPPLEFVPHALSHRF